MNPLNGVQMLGAGNIFRFKNMLSHNYTMYKLTVEAPLQCGNIRFNKHTFEISMLSIEYQIDSIFIGTNNKNEIQSFTADPVDFRKSLNGYPRLRVVYIKDVISLHNVSISLKSSAGIQDIYFAPDTSMIAVSDYMELPQGVYECQIGSSEEKLLEEKLFHLTLGGVYTLAVRQNDNKIDAPKSMKTVTVAGWYLSVAVGNLIVIIITQINLFSSQIFYFVFTLLRKSLFELLFWAYTGWKKGTVFLMVDPVKRTRYKDGYSIHRNHVIVLYFVNILFFF
uniref:Uncharacterized protein LOC114336772 isoform X1 n=1 Tax=Diabrotica virgifera virgifera TaxID=50390 RepID=A0A6P7GDF2_DIAVI